MSARGITVARDDTGPSPPKQAVKIPPHTPLDGQGRGSTFALHGFGGHRPQVVFHEKFDAANVKRFAEPAGAGLVKKASRGRTHGIAGHEDHALLHMRILLDRKSTRLNSSHRCISYAVFCLKKKK